MANKQHKYNILREEITQQQQTIQANRKIEKKTWERHDKYRKKRANRIANNEYNV